MQRRRLLQLLTAGPALHIAGRLYAAPSSASRFLLVFLRGGYDCLNAVVPYSSADYYAARPSIAIPRPSVTVPRPAVAGDPSAPGAAAHVVAKPGVDPQAEAADSTLELDADWGLA